MSAITNVWRQLVQRRLWPVAILLVAALAAVPLALAAQPDPAAPAPAVQTDSGETALATQPIVAQAAVSDRSKRRKVLGTRKNPFGLPPKDTGSASPADSTGSTKADETQPAETGGSAPSTGGVTPGSGVAPSAPSTPVAPAPRPKTYDMYELTVRFGDATASSQRQTLKRLQPLPSAESPVLIYLGVLKDGKTAVFLLDHGVEAVGDGVCKPGPEECETIRLKAGETEFLDVKDETGAVSAQYQLDLIKIHKSSTASAARATASSKAGRRLLKSRVAGEGPTGYRWDSAAGALERRPGETLRATFAGATVALPY
jgi:hypothetical protein